MEYINKEKDASIITVDDAKNDDSELTTNVEPNERNEVRDFQNHCYVSGSKSSWRLFSNEVAERKHTVCRLQIHLDGEETIYFDSNKED